MFTRKLVGRRKTSILELQSVRIGGSLARNAHFDAPTCLVSSLWFSCGLAKSMGEAAKPLLFEGFQAGCHVFLRCRRGTLWHSNLFADVSKVVLCGRRKTFASFPEDELQFLWQARSTLDTLHSTLYTWHSILFTLHSTLYTRHSPLTTLHFTLHTLHATLYTPHSTLDTPHFTLHTLHSTLYTRHSPLYTPHSALYTPHFTLFTVHSTLYSLHSTLYTPHSTHDTPHSPLYTLHSTLRTLHSTLFRIPQSYSALVR